LSSPVMVLTAMLEIFGMINSLNSEGIHSNRSNKTVATFTTPHYSIWSTETHYLLPSKI
jgi:hypothetical protein